MHRRVRPRVLVLGKILEIGFLKEYHIVKVSKKYSRDIVSDELENSLWKSYKKELMVKKKITI